MVVGRLVYPVPLVMVNPVSCLRRALVNDTSAQYPQGDFTEALRPIPTSPELWAARQCPLSFEEILVCQCELGEFRLLAIVSRPDICARLARLDAHVSSLKGSDIFRICVRVRTAKEWQQATFLMDE